MFLFVETRSEGTVIYALKLLRPATVFFRLQINLKKKKTTKITIITTTYRLIMFELCLQPVDSSVGEIVFKKNKNRVEGTYLFKIQRVTSFSSNHCYLNWIWFWEQITDIDNYCVWFFKKIFTFFILFIFKKIRDRQLIELDFYKIVIITYTLIYIWCSYNRNI